MHLNNEFYLHEAITFPIIVCEWHHETLRPYMYLACINYWVLKSVEYRVGAHMDQWQSRQIGAHVDQQQVAKWHNFVFLKGLGDYSTNMRQVYTCGSTTTEGFAFVATRMQSSQNMNEGLLY